MSALRSVADQRALVLAALHRPTTSELVAVADGARRVLAENVLALSAIPVFDNSAMDGYAVRWADLSTGALELVDDVAAGQWPTVAVGPGEAVRVMTGAPIPAGADTVVPLESAHLAGPQVQVISAPPLGRHIRRTGEDLARSAVVAGAGTRLDAITLGSLAAAGVEQVPVYPPVQVAILSTGDELASAGQPLGPAMIPESNSILLSTLAQEAGARVVHRAVTGDCEEAMRGALEAARRAGACVLITSGGVGAGRLDVVKSLFSRQVDFTPVAMQPGRPQGFGVLSDGLIVFALPGNPVAAAVVFDVIVRPALLSMAGMSRIDRRILPAVAGRGWRKNPAREQYTPVTLRVDGARLVATALHSCGGGAHRSGTLARADGWARVGLGIDGVEAGDPVGFIEIGERW